MATTYTSKYASGAAVDAALDKAGTALQAAHIDTDSATTALHHTLGTGANQAAAGNHAHPGVYEPADVTILKQADVVNALDSTSTTVPLSAAQGKTLNDEKQPLDSDLSAIAGLTTTGLIERTGDGTASTTPVTAAGKALLDDADVAAQRTTLGLGNVATANLLGPNAYFAKANPDAVAFTKTGNDTAIVNQLLHVEVNGLILIVSADTSITMPTLVAGTDYAIWCKTDGALEASSNHVTPPSANARRIGGFHYAPGGNATAQSGGNTTPQINEYSFWDLKWRPSCPDPRGMTLVADEFWSDVYLTGVDAITNGSSRYNVVMADGSSPPKVPAMFGGNGSTTYGSFTWFEAMELAVAFGKRCPTQQEFMAAAYGTTEESAIGTDQGSTILNAAYTSKWGLIQATGVLWIWGLERGGAYNTAGWNANTEGRGSEYNAPNAVLLGGAWDDGAACGSRCSLWTGAASSSFGSFGSRFVCDHLTLV